MQWPFEISWAGWGVNFYFQAQRSVVYAFVALWVVWFFHRFLLVSP